MSKGNFRCLEVEKMNDKDIISLMDSFTLQMGDKIPQQIERDGKKLDKNHPHVIKANVDWFKSISEKLSKISDEKLIKAFRSKYHIEEEYGLKKVYEEVLNYFDYYLDTTDDNKCVLALWTIGTHYHQKFPTYPILFLNAMRGSGKTRTLRLISHLASGFEGIVQNSPTESVIFHSQKALFLDEVEKLHRNELNNLHILLNSCYKRGVVVTRMEKTKKDDKETYRPQEFSLYKPVCMANIKGLDSVLENRALIIFLEKSFDKFKTSRLEDFETRLQDVKELLGKLVTGDSNDRGDSSDDMSDIIIGWNDYIDNLQKTVSRPSLLSPRHLIYEKVYQKGISGRTLELCFPLLILANMISDEVFKQALTIFGKITKRRRESELDDEHVLIYRFVSVKDTQIDFKTISELYNEFQLFCGIPLDMSPSAFSKALERLQLVKERKRTNKQRLVRLDVEKAKQRIGLFDKEAGI